VGFSEDAKEMVASSDSDYAAFIGAAHCIYGRQRRRAVRVYAVLGLPYRISLPGREMVREMVNDYEYRGLVFRKRDKPTGDNRRREVGLYTR